MMLTPRTRILHHHLGTLLPATARTISRPALTQTRKITGPLSKDPDNMGGPGGQEHFPESGPIRRHYAMTTMYGVLAACSVMVAAKVARMSMTPKTGYVLVHDSSKGELDDVKFMKESDLPKTA